MGTLLYQKFTYRYDVILLIGQSNMGGRGTTAVIDPTPPLLLQYSCAPTSPNYQTLMTGSDPLEMTEAVETGQIGPGHSFAVQYMANNAGKGVVLVPCAVGATCLVASPAQWAVGNTLHENAVTKANAAIAAAQALAPASKFVGIAWLQGEQDADTITQTAYAAALDATIDDYRSRITGAATSWFAVLGLAPGFVAGSTFRQGVSNALIDTPNRKTRATYTAGPSGDDDGLHYNAVGQRILGPNAANSLIGL
jgi:hypothetical protein